jgi:hypothetical protein
MTANPNWRKQIHRILQTHRKDTKCNQNYTIGRLNHPIWLNHLLCFILFFSLSASNLATWTTSSREIACEQFQAPCIAMFHGFNQADAVLSKLAMPECFQFCHPGINVSFPVLDSELIPLSDPDTCKCSSGTRGQTSTFRGRGRLTNLIQTPVCFSSPTTPFQNFFSKPDLLWKKRLSLRPPGHLKPLSSIVLII